MKDSIRTFTGKEPKPKTPWSSFPSTDGYCQYLDKADDEFIDNLIKEGKLNEDWNAVKDGKDPDDEESSRAFFEKREQIVKEAPHNKDWVNDINAYDFHHMCFAFNPIVGYELAKN